MKKLILSVAAAMLCATAEAQQSFSDYRPLNGDDVQTTQKKMLALESCSFANIATNTTTTVKSGKGVLHTITINTAATAGGTATVYDNTAGSGTKIATIKTDTATETLLYDVAFSTGLTIVTATAAADITVAYR